MNSDSRYTIPAGTHLQVRRISDTGWKWHTTTKKLDFEKYDSRTRSHYDFRHDEGYILRVYRKDIAYRERHSL